MKGKMKKEIVQDKLTNALARYHLSAAEAVKLFSLPRSTFSANQCSRVPRVEKLLFLSQYLQLDPEFFFSEMPIEIAEMASPEEIERKLKQARFEVTVDRLFRLCQEKGKTIYDFALRYDRLTCDERTGFMRMTVDKLVSLSEGLSVDPRVLLFGEAFQPVPYPVTEAMLELLRRDIELRKKVYSMMSVGPGGIL